MTKPTLEEMRVMIAEKRGWCFAPVDCINANAFAMKREGDTILIAHALSDIPNYHADLNACAEMEKVLVTEEQWRVFQRQISIVMFGEKGEKPYKDKPQCEQHITHCSAPQRCEAFCRVFWPERFKNE